MTETVLIVAAHPDDETLGCGGLIAKMTAGGARVVVAIMTDGVGAREGTEADAHYRWKAATNATAILGAQITPLARWQHWRVGEVEHEWDGRVPDNAADTVARLRVTQLVETHIKECDPRIIVTHHHQDLNIDHRRVSEAVLTAARPLPGTHVREILAFETPSVTGYGPVFGDFRPTLFVDIEATLDRKIAALACYGAEIRTFPHPRSEHAVRALATWRGASVGMVAAEAFEVLRIMR